MLYLGGCHAPSLAVSVPDDVAAHSCVGAGNISTEDLGWMLEQAGFDTGIDVSMAMELRRWTCALVQTQPRSGLSGAGIFPAPQPASL